MKVFLGGTCADSNWRMELIPLLTIDYFNPVVENWTGERQLEELRQRKSCDVLLYVITRSISVYSIAEAVEDSIRYPKKTFFVLVRKDGEHVLTDMEVKHLDAVGLLIWRNGGEFIHLIGGMSTLAGKLNRRETE